MTLQSIDPATGAVIAEYEALSWNMTAGILDAVHRARGPWAEADLEVRASLMRAAAGVLRQEADRLSRLMTREMGKILGEARSEVEKCAWVCEYYAEHAARFLSDEPADEAGPTAFVTYQPLGTILAVMPWNFPLWQVFRFAAPALMAGNVGVLKHASNVPGCALAIEDVFRQAGFPKDVFRTLLVGSEAVSSIVEDPRIAAVTLTGSAPAGRSVAATAGACLKKTVLELGGSDPYLILKDADVATAADACVTSRMINAGQSCIAAKRFIVEEPVAEAFESAVIQAMSRKVTGDPQDPKTDLGPLARLDLRSELHEQVQHSVEAGAACPLGGQLPEGPGAFYPPTVLTNVRNGMPAYGEELFGPVAAIIRVADEDQAVAVANDTEFGLGAAVFTRDPVRGRALARERLVAGACFVNTFVRSDPRLPFGGIRASGYGRELGRHGIHEFVNTKTIWVE